MKYSEIEKVVKHHFPSLNGDSLNSVTYHSSFLKSTKGTRLISEGKRHNYFYIILKGAVKSFYTKESKEICMWFAFEDEAVGTMSTCEGYPSKETLELLEDSEFLRFNIKELKELSKSDLQIIHLLNTLTVEHTLCIEERLYQLQFMTSEERYNTLMDNSPDILQRVSLTDIASYLGVSRETLSRIRGKKQFVTYVK